MMATFVLVPGAWGGRWGWQWLAPYLREAGHRVHPITLSGLGERIDLAHAGITLDTHITDVVTALEFADLSDGILVGHSYAGMVITGVADRVPERLAQVVYLDATVPENGQSFYDVWPEDRDADLAAAEAAGTPGFVPAPLGWIEEAVTDEAVRAVLLERMTPHPLATFAQPIHLSRPDAATVPRAHVRCVAGRDPADPQPAFLARVQSDPAWRYVEIPFDHLAPVAAPRETAAALLALL
jgi:pimeloyl-ACP methyl ester carboxylesterase